MDIILDILKNKSKRLKAYFPQDHEKEMKIYSYDIEFMMFYSYDVLLL